MGARPITFLDYIANDELKPAIIEEIVNGIAKSCKENDIALVGGETAEMPDTYLKGEHDLVGIVTGIVDKDKIIDGSKIKPRNILLGLPSTGLQTNGYSLARKLFFEIGQYGVHDKISEFNKTLGETLLEPSYIYNPFIQSLLDNNVKINGMAHISGGGLIENIPRILPDSCAVEVRKDSWNILPIFKEMQKLGNISESEMFRTFNMGIGLVVIVNDSEVDKIKSQLKGKISVFEIGKVIESNRVVKII